MTLEHLTAARGSSRLIDIQPMSIKTPEPTLHSVPVLRKKQATHSYHSVNQISDRKPDKKLVSVPVDLNSQNFKSRVYSIVLRIILAFIQLFHQLQVYYLTAYYFIYEVSIKYKLVNENNCEYEKRFLLPKHVCVVLNDQTISASNYQVISHLYSRIADLLVFYDRGSNNMEALTFYRFDDVSSEIKEKVLFDFRHERVDKNNNLEGSSLRAEFLNDLKSISFSYNFILIYFIIVIFDALR